MKEWHRLDPAGREGPRSHTATAAGPDPTPARSGYSVRSRLTLPPSQYPEAGSTDPSSGSPATKWATLARIRAASNGTIISQVSAVCGVMMQLGVVQSGWPSGRGSGSVTSRPAPAMVPRCRAWTRAAGVHVAAPGHVDQPGPLIHHLQLPAPDDAGGGRRQGQRQENDQRAAQGLLELVHRDRVGGPFDGTLLAADDRRLHPEGTEEPQQLVRRSRPRPRWSPALRGARYPQANPTCGPGCARAGRAVRPAPASGRAPPPEERTTPWRWTIGGQGRECRPRPRSPRRRREAAPIESPAERQEPRRRQSVS